MGGELGKSLVPTLARSPRATAIEGLVLKPPALSAQRGNSRPT